MINLKEITIEEAHLMQDTHDVILVDIRDANSYQQAHITGALHLNKASADQFIATADKSTPVICYCYHGNSSKNASLFLQEKGFKEVYSMIGGFEAWREAFPIESSS